MKKLIFLFLFIPCIVNAQVFIHAGASPLKGLIGAEFQVQNFSLSTGYRFNYLWSAGRIHSWSGSLNYYFRIEPALLYVSAGFATKGIVAQNEYGMWTTPVCAQYLMVGTRYYPHEVAKGFPERISFDLEIGGSISNYSSMDMVIDFEVNVAITRLRNGSR